MRSVIYFCPALLNLHQRFFCCLLACFPPEHSWQQQEQAQAEGAFVAWHQTHKWLGCSASKTFSSMKKPCHRGKQQALLDHSPPNLWLVTFNGISSHVLELHSYATIWPIFFMATYYQLLPTPIHSLNVSLLLLDKCQAQSIMRRSEFPGMGSLGIQHLGRSHASTCSVLILIKRRADVISAFLKLPLPFGFFKSIKQFDTTGCALLILIFTSCNVTISMINTGWDCFSRSYTYFE